MWRHDMERFRMTGPFEESSGEFLSQKPVMLSLVVYFIVSLDNLLNKQLRCLWLHDANVNMMNAS